MLISDWINVALCLLSFILAVISVLTVIITLRQNQYMIENSTRPYVTIYSAVTAFDATLVYLVLRNYGQSSALITKFSSNVDFSRLTFMEGFPIPFEHIVGRTIAPNQAIHALINHIPLKEMSEPLSFTIRYSSLGKVYEEQTSINFQSDCDFLIAHAENSRSTGKIIANVLEEIAVRQL